MSHPPPRALEPGALRRDVSPKPGEGGQPGFELQWKTTLESPARHGVSLSPGVVTSGVNIFTPLSTIAAPSNQIFAIDNDTGNLFWTRRFDGTLAAGTAACPGGISGALTRMVSLTTPAPGPGRGGGRGRGAYSSAVGEPGAGVPIPSRGGGAGRGTPAPATTRPRRQRRRAAGAPPSLRRRQRFRQVNRVRHRSRRTRRHKEEAGACFDPPASSMR